MNDISHPKNIVGFGSLLNPNAGDSSSLDKLEQRIIHGGHVKQQEKNMADAYRIEMESLSKDFNMSDFDSVIVETQDDEKTNGIQTSGYTASDGSPPKVLSEHNAPQLNHKINDLDVHLPSFDDSSKWNTSIMDNQFKNMTMEEQKQKHIDSVINNMDDTSNPGFNLDHEREEDDKASLLEQIDLLRSTLEDASVDLSSVIEVTKNNSTQEIMGVYRALKLKNDRSRYCSMAEELILAAAQGLEYLFDGKKEWLGRKPDLVGWSRTVRVKLRRMRFETSTFVRSIMQDYNMNAGVRLMLELIPSMFLYSKSRQSAKVDTIASDTAYTNAISTMNNA